MSRFNFQKGNRRRDPRSRFRASGGPSLPRGRLPLWCLSSFMAMFLMAPAWVSTETFLTCLRHAASHQLWASEEVQFFCAGVAAWLGIFLFMRRPLVIYVFGHELTHAIWVLLAGGKVSGFKVSSDGGHIISDRHNVWIALAPYFFPIYSIAVIAAYGLVSLACNLEPYHRWLYALIGLTWAFHITFSIWMIPRGQTDLTYYGTFFSLVVIYIVNLGILTALLLIASPHVTLGMWAVQWVRHAEDFAAGVIICCGELHRLIRHALAAR